MAELFRSLLSRIDTALYIQIWSSRIKATDANGNVVFDEAPMLAVKALADGKKQVLAFGNAALTSIGEAVEVIRPFQHPRMLLADFIYGEQLLKSIFAKASGGKLFQSSPRAFIHPMEKVEGGLTSIEMRALHELAAGAGAREVHVHEGAELKFVDGQLVGYQSSTNLASSARVGNSLPWQWIKTLILIVALAAWIIFRIIGN